MIKITVWKLIAEEINNGDGNTGMVVSAIQCEKNEKKFRDKLDHNRKSVNDKKVCPCYDEPKLAMGTGQMFIHNTLQVQSHAQGI